MTSGFSMLSFDLFGLFRRKKTSAPKKDETSSGRGDIFFVGMFPVLW